MTAPAPRRTIGRVLPAAPGRSALTMLVFTALLYVVEVADVISGQTLELNGIHPRDTGDLDGILWSPLLHGDWAHLAANTVPFLVFGFLAMAGGVRQFVLVTATIWLLGGLGVWFAGDDGSYHIGASGLVFGWLAFLLTRGFFAGSGRQILLAVVLFLVWGGILLGVLPGQPGISWQGHLFGALAGVLAAWLVARADRPAVAAP
ncbi:rhomboid family intramembrane serine protease [Pseudonocardia sp. KRD-184]|uniref:Rhomboid family intramembrane serine protease n=1 Tax=Pseudonocardia oceani TaxID=2792013 RepID=A0ABS6UCL7_9PSEU|nr:rhomboid family intramembrane serine protease [Pseudonocardia oceani]MBW0090074.1 rhomboid family intramembrane serine protease [Pseudonocardia oceani]MBW0097247.1 rhomboid family intramembrane serine protease [Pseudonocardia oceani]MBW0109910.1 rhomboid family intramembrane serine protease [Pseudonocardia oceani]MBW0122806.1 rhomboid family intramembrane serine protease [Pseudonocardia oceani]MBW0129984.1 rhomboid family intramembrane serine protease [Pseudonocardia oceani]